MLLSEVVIGDFVRYVGRAEAVRVKFSPCLVVQRSGGDSLTGHRVSVLSFDGIVRDFNPYFLTPASLVASEDEK